MSKLFKHTLLLSISIGVLTVLQACDIDNGSEPEENKSLVGMWEMTTVILKDTPAGTLTMTASAFLGMSGTEAVTSTLTFNEDGSAALLTTFTDDSEETVPGSWSIEGDSLVVDGVGIDDTVTYDLDDTTLTLNRIFQIDFDGDGSTEDTDVDMVYTRL